MNTKKAFLSIDVVAQLILLILLVVSTLLAILSGGETAIYVGLVLFFLGLWQVGSGILFGIIRNDGKRAEYVIKSLAYVFFLAFGCSILEGSSINGFVTWSLIILFFLVIPSGIAVWYFRHSQADLEKLRLEIKNEIFISNDKDNILDSEEILNHERS